MVHTRRLDSIFAFGGWGRVRLGLTLGTNVVICLKIIFVKHCFGCCLIEFWIILKLPIFRKIEFLTKNKIPVNVFMLII